MGMRHGNWALASVVVVAAAASLLAGCGAGAEVDSVDAPDESPERICLDCPNPPPPGIDDGGGSSGGAVSTKADIVNTPIPQNCTTGSVISLWISNVGGASTHDFWTTIIFHTGSGDAYAHIPCVGLNGASGEWRDVQLPSNCIYPSCSGYEVIVDSTSVVDEANESNNVTFIQCH
jgi:hypothetical protein